MKVPLVEPAGTITVDGTAAEPLELESETTAPLAGAAALRRTVPCEDAPPATLVGLRLMEESVPPVGLEEPDIESAALLTLLEYHAAIVTEPEDAVAYVRTLIVALIEPCGIMKLAGTLTALLLELFSTIIAPPYGAGAASEIVACELAPAVTEVGARLSEERL